MEAGSGLDGFRRHLQLPSPHSFWSDLPMHSPGERRLIFSTDTPEGRLLVLDVVEGLRFIVDTSPKASAADDVIREYDITRFRMKSTAPTQSIRALHGHLRQWLEGRQSRSGVYRLTIMPESCVGDEDIVISGAASPPILLNRAGSAGLERAIAHWLAGRS